MLASERDAKMKRSVEINFLNKSNLGMLGSSTLNKNGVMSLDNSSNKSAEMPRIAGKESEKLQRLLQYL